MVYGNIPGPQPQIALTSDRTPGEFVYSFMSAAGSISMNTDGSSSAVTYSYIPPAGRSAQITRMNMVILDPDQRPSRFGGGSALAVGCRLLTIDGAAVETFDFCNGETLKMNADFTLLAGVDNETDTAPADDGRYIRWTIEKAGLPLLLRDGEGISMLIQDDLSGIDDFRILVQGVLLPI